MSSGVPRRPSGHGGGHPGDAVLVAVEQVGLLGADQAGGDEVEAHLGRPLHGQGLGEADAGRPWPRRRRRVPGDGRMPLTLPMLTIDPPSSWCCMTALAAWDTCSGGEQVEPDDRLGEPGRRGGRVGRGRAAGVVDHHVESAAPGLDGGVAPRAAAWSGSRRSAATNARLPTAGRHRLVRLGPGGDDDGRRRRRGSGRRCPRPTPLVPPVTSTVRPEKSSGIGRSRPSGHAT